MGNFRGRLRAAAEILATGQGDVKSRLRVAVTSELVFANVPKDSEIPEYFARKHALIVEEFSSRTWGPKLDGDLGRATIHPMRVIVAATLARHVWKLYTQFEEYEHTGLVPDDSSVPSADELSLVAKFRP